MYQLTGQRCDLVSPRHSASSHMLIFTASAYKLAGFPWKIRCGVPRGPDAIGVRFPLANAEKINEGEGRA
jgi:hypothetical protein